MSHPIFFKMGSQMNVRGLLIGLTVIALLGGSLGLKYSVEITKQALPAVFVDKFGFMPGGIWNMTLTTQKEYAPEYHLSMGIFAVVSKSSRPSFSFTGHRCPLDLDVISELSANYSTLQFLSYPMSVYRKSIQVEVNRAQLGFWSFHFIVCGNAPLYFHGSLDVSMENVNMAGKKTYLSAGEIPLPNMYLLSGFTYLALALVWIRLMRAPTRAVNRLHWLMLILIFSKIMSTFCQSFMYFTMDKTGEPKGWNIAFYVFQTIRGLILFVVVLLIGTGWQLVKSYFSDSDRCLFFIVVPLQFAANVGLNVCSENDLHNFWLYFFHLLDIVCCMLVLLPVVRNIDYLQGKSDKDGKYKSLVSKLERFSYFYIILICYIYVTRVVSILLSSYLSTTLAWVSDCIVELATLAFYIMAGYEFRPARDNTLFHSVDDHKDHERGNAKETV